jgi:hypothetical protein
MVRENDKPLSFQIGLELKYGPHDSQALFLRGGVVALGTRKATTPIPDRVGGYIRLGL